MTNLPSKIIILCMLVLQSCTYSNNMVNVRGSGSDIIDEDQKADATVNPNIAISPTGI